MAYNTYTKTGPFTNGAAPGISAAFLNAMETFQFAGWFDSLITSDGSGGLAAVKQTLTGPTNNNMAGVSVNGQTSGSATMYQYMQGSASKKTIINLANYRITANQTLALPTAYTGRSALWVFESNGGHFSCLTGGSGGS